jgi:hypothetical protein
MANKNTPENESENLNDNNGDDNFGLPDLDYKPLESTEETTSTSSYQYEESESPVSQTEEASQTYSYTPAEEPKSNAPIIIAIVIGLVLLVAAFLIYQYWYVPRAEKAKKELLAKQEAKKRESEEADRLAKEKEEAERRRLEEERAAAETVKAPPAGTIETLSDRMGRYHVVISSAIDGDLIMDRAKKLSAEGITTYIIPPFGKKKFYRLTVGDFATFEDAQANADQEKAKYGDALWVIKY